MSSTLKVILEDLKVLDHGLAKFFFAKENIYKGKCF